MSLSLLSRAAHSAPAGPAPFPCQRSQKDDMAKVLDRLVHADVIVMATPVYFYTMAAQMKTLIDRTCARYQEKGVVYGTGAWESGAINDSSAMKEAYQMGLSL